MPAIACRLPSWHHYNVLASFLLRHLRFFLTLLFPFSSSFYVSSTAFIILKAVPRSLRHRMRKMPPHVAASISASVRSIREDLFARASRWAPQKEGFTYSAHPSGILGSVANRPIPQQFQHISRHVGYEWINKRNRNKKRKMGREKGKGRYCETRQKQASLLGLDFGKPALGSRRFT